METRCTRLSSEANIQETDVISGALYLKLIRAYKDYDERQKKVIKRLQTDLDFLMFENPELENLLERHNELNNLRNSIAKLKKDNEWLLCRNVQLQQQIRDLHERVGITSEKSFG